MAAPYTLILLRHGSSEWNEKNLFTGWVDVRLSETGVAEAKRAGELLRPVLLEGFGLVETLQRTVVTLVETPGALHRDPEAVGDIERVVRGLDGAGQHRGVQHVGLEAGIAEQLARPLGLGDAGLAETHVDPAGEQVLLVPFAAAVAQEDQGIGSGHASNLSRDGAVPRRWQTGTMASGAVGTVTRGTTNTNRLRRVDRWIAALPELRRATDPLVVDLGYGASGVTALELHQRLAKARADVQVLGLEIEPGRVRTANEQLARVRAGGTPFDPAARIAFGLGGFEVPLPDGRHAAVIRAFNVLRQYREVDVAAAWERMQSRLQPHGVLVEGTCDEIGRIASWIALDREGPRSLTISLRRRGLEAPSVVAERLPKALIHRNVPGERVHRFLSELDREWQIHSPLAAYGPRQRWIAVAEGMRGAGWPVLGGRKRWRLGELTVAWEAVAPSE